MPITFTPPTRSEVPPVLPEGSPEQSEGAFRLFRFFRARPAGVNVYLYKSGSLSAAAHGRVTEDDPTALYDSLGVLTTDGWQDIEVVFWGGHAAVVVTSDQAVALTAAGYLVDTSGSNPTDPPILTQVSPSSGIASTSVSLFGTSLGSATSVTVDGVSVSFTIVSALKITFTAPAHADGLVTVAVTTPFGSTSSTFTYSTPALGDPPAINSLSPNTGIVGISVVISGTNFSGATGVSFGGAAAAFSVNSPTQITATTPSHADGTISVTVTGPTGTSNTSPFTYTSGSPADPHPGPDVLQEDGSFLLLEDGTSTLELES